MQNPFFFGLTKWETHCITRNQENNGQALTGGQTKKHEFKNNLGSELFRQPSFHHCIEKDALRHARCFHKHHHHHRKGLMAMAATTVDRSPGAFDLQVPTPSLYSTLHDCQRIAPVCEVMAEMIGNSSSFWGQNQISYDYCRRS